MSRPAVLVLALCAAACSKTYISGPLDLAKAEQGAIFVETMDLGNDRLMMRGAVVVDGPPHRVLNLYRDPENLPTWHSAFLAVNVVHREGDTSDVDVTMRPILGRILSPMRTRIRVDGERGVVSMTGFENDWVASFQTTITAEKLDPEGKRTLVSGYSIVVPKLFGASLATGTQEERLADALANARNAVKLPRYADPPPVAPAQKRGKVVVPAFASSGVKDDTVRILNRVFAEELMRTSPWNVVTDDEAATILVHARQRQLVGCDDESCAPDVARTLDAERLVSGRAGVIGGKYVLNLSLLRYPEGTVERRVSVEADDEASLAVRTKDAAETLGRN